MGPSTNYRTLNPASEELIQSYPELTWQETEERAQKAIQTFYQWKKVPLSERAPRMLHLAELLRKKKTDFASLITQEMGKPVVQAESEVEKCAWACEFYAHEAANFLKEDSVVTDAKKSYVRYDPLGVILGIMPWNFPFWQVLRFSVPAMMAGNAVVLKHAPNVPRSALALERLCRDAGFPQDLFQSLFISHETAATLIESPWIAGVSLTGSSRAGAAVAALAGKNLKKTVLELGGSDPFIVLKDADLEKAVSVAVQSRMVNAGQSCIAAKRFMIVQDVFEKFKRMFADEVQKIKVGDPLDRANFMGPLAREDLLLNLERQVKESVSQGVRLVTGTGRLQRKGYFYTPTVLEGVVPGMVAFEEEIFGPVASLILVKDQEEAVELANRTSYGLGATLWTQDQGRAEEVARQIEAGSVFINSIVKSDPRLPFGGIKRSGYGRELSALGLREFTNIKTVWIA